MRSARKSIGPGVVALATACTCVPAAAFDAKWKDFEIKVDNLYSLGAALRMSERDPALVGLGNGGSAYSTNHDDGNLAYDRGDLVAGATKLTSGLTISYKDFGVFARGSGIFNPTLDDQAFFDTADYGIGRELGQDELALKSDTVRQHVGSDAGLLDAFVFGSLEFGGYGVSMRVGQQSLDWGESLQMLHGLNSLLALDTSRRRVPGAALEEIIRPTGMVWGSVGLSERFSVEAFYQYDWQPTLADPAGTFWSVDDLAVPGGTQLNLGFGRVDENIPAGVVSTPASVGAACLPIAPLTPLQDCVPLGSTVPRLTDRLPGSGGQFGGGVNVVLPDRNDLSMSVYMANYHSRLPLLSALSRSLPTLLPQQADSAAFFLEYPEDQRLYGASFSTTLPGIDVALAGEYSLKQGQPLQVDDVELLLATLGLPSQLNPTGASTLGNQLLQGWRRLDVSQAGFNLTRVFGPRLGYDQLTLFGEAGYTYVHGLPPENVLRFEAPGTDTPADALVAAAQGVPPQREGYATQQSWGYRLAARVTFSDVLKGFDLSPTLRFVHDVGGITPAPVGNFVEGRKQAALSLGVAFRSAWTAEVSYTNHFGGGLQNLLSDRDVLDFNLSYGF